MSKEKQIEEMAKCCTYYHNGECCVDATNICDCDLMCEMCGVFANLEIAGYRKQSEGEWIEQIKVARQSNKPPLLYYQCSLCGVYLAKRANFCPNCGAKMKGGAE